MAFPTDIAVDENGDVDVVHWDLNPEHHKKPSGGSFDSGTKMSEATSGDDAGMSVDTDDRDSYHAAFESAETDEATHAFGSSPAVWTRSTDADENDEVTSGSIVFVTEGDTYSDLGFRVISDDPIDVGTDPIEWDFFGGTAAITAGNGLVKNPTRIDFIAADNSLDVLADGVQVRINDELAEPTLETVPEGIRVGTATQGRILIAQGSTNPTSFEEIGGDIALEKDGTTIVQLAGSLIVNNATTGGGIRLAQASAGQVILGQSSGDPQYVDLSGDLTVDGSGNVTLDSEFVKNGDLYVRESFTGNGTQQTFTLSATPIFEGSAGATYKEMVFLNGVLQVEGSSEDYTRPNGTDISFNDAPFSGEPIRVVYLT